MYRKLKKVNSPKINNPIKKWTTDVIIIFLKKVKMAKNTHEKILTILGYKGNANHTTLRLHLTPIIINYHQEHQQ
jgi:hypothetical protein